MRKFEIPFRVDTIYPEFIRLYKPFINQIECIYFASYKDDGINTRKLLENDFRYPSSFDEYVSTINEVKKYFNLQVLIQKKCTEELIEKYYNLGIKRFVINDDNLAKKIKEKYNDILLTLSITRRLKFEEIISNDFSMYDFIVLDFWFCRRLDYIKQLPKKYKYVIIPNNVCSCEYNKYCYIHWFDELNFQYCPKDGKTLARIYPNDLKYFDDFIHHFKFQGRECEVGTCFDDVRNYLFADVDYYNKQ